MYQQIILIGNLGSDPELRHTASGTPVCAFRMAVNKHWTTPEGEKREKTVWFRVTTWKKQAELVNQYLAKGKQVMVIGEVEEASVFVNKAGDPAASLEVTATTIKFMGGGDSSEEATARKVAQAVSKRVSEEDIPF